MTAPRASGPTLDIAVFAHDEAAGIADIVAALGAQTLLADPEADVRALVLANGCSDDTAARARAAIAALPAPARDRIAAVELAEGGKSRTWNRFVHDLSRPEAELLAFMDADIAMPNPDLLARMRAAIAARPELAVFNSRPVKDLVHAPDPEAGATARLIAAAGGTLDDWRTAICGQLYMMRTAAAREVFMPIGLPVEDGFLCAMVLTGLLSGPGRMERIDGDPELFHVYESIRTAPELLRHQTRIVIGGAVNAALFGLIRREAPRREQARALLREAAADEGWLPRALRAELPRAPWGYVPFGFATKRLGAFRRGSGRLRPKAAATVAVGVCFDATVWVLASLRMARGAGAGHW